MRSFGLDVHRDFCEVAVADEDGVRSAGRILDGVACDLIAKFRSAARRGARAWSLGRPQCSNSHSHGKYGNYSGCDFGGCWSIRRRMVDTRE
jgi:hypothetical protein